MDTEHIAITEPVRRLEVFTGAGRRRTWRDEDKARIVAEIATSGDSVCAVARRHGLSPQQLFGRRRQLRDAEAGPSEANELRFVPAVERWIGCCATEGVARQSRSQRRNDRGRDRRRDSPDRPRRGRKDTDGGAASIEGRRVIGPTGAVRVMVATRPVDFRKGAEGLSALVRETMTADPFSGAVYVFRAKRADRIKLIFWDGTGLCLFAKRLEDGIFRWPKIEDGVMRLSAAQLSALLEGLDWRRVHEARETVAPTQPG